jgi:RNA polymerase sigma-70 factor (ECF subfamily)
MTSNNRTAVMTGEEQLLVENVQRGEMAAFQELVEKYKQKVYYMALDMTGNHHDAEDLSQEVFMKVYSSIKDFRGESRLSTWLYRIAMNTCLGQNTPQAFEAGGTGSKRS